MKIEILGSGCAKCNRLEKNVREAVKQLGLQAEIVKIENVQEIIDRGLMMSPALFIDGEARSVGWALSVKEIKEILSGF